MTIKTLNNHSIILLHERADKNKYDSNTLSHRLKLCLNLYSMSQSELARLIDVKPQIIQYLCTKNVKSSRFTFELAEALGVDYTWLSTGEGVMRQPVDAQMEEYKIPLFSWVNLDQITNKNSIHSHNSEFIFSSLSYKCSLIATRIVDASMEPRFEKGTSVIFDLDEISHHGDFVLVKLNKANRWVFRELVIKDDSKELSPVNNSIFKQIVLEPEDKITGVLIQTICDFKRERV